MMDIHPKSRRPTCEQIDQACDMYNAGASIHDYRAAAWHVFGLSDAEMALAWCAAIAAFNVRERMFPT